MLLSHSPWHHISIACLNCQRRLCLCNYFRYTRMFYKCSFLSSLFSFQRKLSLWRHITWSFCLSLDIWTEKQFSFCKHNVLQRTKMFLVIQVYTAKRLNEKSLPRHRLCQLGSFNGVCVFMILKNYRIKIREKSAAILHKFMVCRNVNAFGIVRARQQFLGTRFFLVF